MTRFTVDGNMVHDKCSDNQYSLVSDKNFLSAKEYLGFVNPIEVIKEGVVVERFDGHYEGSNSPIDAINDLFPVMKAIEALSEKERIYGNLTPDKIVKTENGYRLADFGIGSKGAEEGPYTAPECNDITYGATGRTQSDVYSLCAILKEQGVGHPMVEKGLSVYYEDRPSITELILGSEDVNGLFTAKDASMKVVEMTTQKKSFYRAEERLNHIAEQEEEEQLLTKQAEEEEVVVEDYMTEEKKKLNPLILVIGAVLFVLIGVGGFFVINNKKPEVVSQSRQEKGDVVDVNTATEQPNNLVTKEQTEEPTQTPLTLQPADSTDEVTASPSTAVTQNAVSIGKPVKNPKPTKQPEKTKKPKPTKKTEKKLEKLPDLNAMNYETAKIIAEGKGYRVKKTTVSSSMASGVVMSYTINKNVVTIRVSKNTSSSSNNNSNANTNPQPTKKAQPTKKPATPKVKDDWTLE